MENKNGNSGGQGATPFAQTYFHGTKADLKVGDLIGSGFTFRVVGEVTIWQGHSSEQVKVMKKNIEKLKEQGIDSLND